MELKLRRTWHEISEFLKGSRPNPLRIAELINRFPPSSWTFRFTFDGRGRTTVAMDCEVFDAAAAALGNFDGTLEEIFYADMIDLRHLGKYITGDLATLLGRPPDSNLMTLRTKESNVRENCHLCVLEGFWQSDFAPSKIQNDLAVQSFFIENTWLGSPKFIDSGHFVRWIVFGTENTIDPGSRYNLKLGTSDSYCTQAGLFSPDGSHLGQAAFHTSTSLKRDEVYTTFGPIDVNTFRQPFSSPRQGPYWIVEIDSPALTKAAQEGRSVASHVATLISSLERARNLVETLTCFRSYMERTVWSQQASSANKLQVRQERAKSGDCVVYSNLPVMLVPSNENEVLVLLCKLEGLQALPFSEFCLWEYTARAGIDAIATYQVREVDVPKQFSAIEVEYYFENFLDHNHPHQQVDLVVCWDFRAVEVPPILNQRCEWLFEYRNDDIFQVAVLSRIPDIRIGRI